MAHHKAEQQQMLFVDNQKRLDQHQVSLSNTKKTIMSLLIFLIIENKFMTNLCICEGLPGGGVTFSHVPFEKTTNQCPIEK